MNHTIYSYRLTAFSGAAPCMDKGLLTLAICKRDMRRVIGREFNRRKQTGNENPIWFIGIVGKGLYNQKTFRDAFPDPKPGDILYIAKLTDVRSYEDYFSDLSDDRPDKIYYPDPDGAYGTEKKFSPKEDNSIHDSKELWDRDWDVQHDSKETFVLYSECFAVLNHAQSEKLKSLDPPKACYPDRQGHRHFPAKDDSSYIRYLETLTDPVGNPDKEKRIKKLCSHSGCGKVKAV